MANKKILVGVTGGIAAYKSAELVRRLREVNAQVRVVMTKAGTEFITPLTMQAVSGQPVHLDLLDPNAEAAMGHIELARWADAIIVAPASADFIARLAHGRADDLLTTLCLASKSPLLVAPAMNQQMWLNAATQHNLELLKQRQIKILGPAEGSQACGEVGPGRLLEPQEILAALDEFFLPPLLKNCHMVITAGPTRENIDPVRYIGNYSSGKMGFALAEAAVNSGAQVTLISGPVNLATPSGVDRIDVESAEEMYQAVMAHVKKCDVFIAAAAVADYRAAKISEKKLVKNNKEMLLKLIANRDIVADVAKRSKASFTIGFAAQTEDVVKQAKAKLIKKKLDMVVANLVGKNLAFEQDENEVTVLWKNGSQYLPLMSKQMLARKIIMLVADRLKKKL